MAGNTLKFVDKRFQNWIKANLALNITKEGIEDTVLTEINTFHQDTLNDILSPEQILNNDLCTQCKNENILPCPTRGICIVKTGICSFHTQQKWYRPCPKHVCDRLREKIKQCHKYNFPSWKNTKAENWCHNSWELAKCYMPPDGYLGASSIAETDINGISSVIMNHSAFKDNFDMYTCGQVREVSRKVRHCPDLCINDQDLKSFIGILLSFLSCSKLLQGDSTASESVQKITKLKADSLTITTHDITKVLQDAIHESTRLSLNEIDKRVAERAKEVKTDLDKLEIVTSTSIKDILNAKSKAVDEIAKQRQVALDNLQSATEQLKRGVNKDIDQAKEKIYADIEGLKQTSIKEINQTSVIYSRRLVEADYQQLKNDFKTDLLAFNQQYHSTIPLSSVFEEQETNLQGFYVQPAMNSIKVQKTTVYGPAEEVRTPVTCLHEVFYRRSKPCSNIYLTSGAGQGKTVYCKQLVLTWCNAHRNQSDESKLFVNNIQIMKGFEYVFLLSLRDSTVQCDVDYMISNQIVQNLSQHSNYSPKFLQTLLHREKCLILLDGLDEWSHPKPSVTTCTKTQDGLPHRKARANCTILTTTRSWKLSIVTLKSSQIDNHVEIGYLDDDSSRQLIANAVRKILVQDDIDKSVNDRINSQIDDITSTIHSRSTPEFEMNPLILTYMICLLCDGKSLGQSKSELYANIIDFLLHRGEKRNQCNTNVVFADSAFDTVLLSAVFRNCGHIKTHEKFLLSLGQLAFKALFGENEEQSLDFKCSLVDSYLTEDEQKFCLSTGLLIQNKLPGRLTTKEIRVSFSHKTFQEFFSALYIYSVTDINHVNGVKESVIKKCNSVEKILEVSNVFVYLSGLCPERLHILSKELSKIINSDKMITQFRCESSILFLDGSCFDTAKALQDMYIACVNESKDANREAVLPLLQDIIIDRCCNEERYFQGLQKLTITNVKTIKSISLSHCNSEMDFKSFIGNLNLEHTHALESLHLLCPILSDDLEQILNGSVSTLLQLSACSLIFENGSKQDLYSTLSHTSLKFIRDMNNLTSLNLGGFCMSHCVLESLIAYLKQRTCMEEITLIDITCIDHGQSCPGFSMDLSQHVQLDKVGISNLPIVHIEINTSALEQCYAGPLHTQSPCSSFLKCLHGAKNLRKFVIGPLQNENDIYTLIDTIPRLINVTFLSVHGADMNNTFLKLSSGNANIEIIYLRNVSMTISSLEQLVGQFEHFQQSVMLVLANCTVTPVKEYERLTDQIKSSGRFKVFQDGEWEDVFGQKMNCFTFETIRD